MIAQQKATSRLTDALRTELSKFHVDLIERYAEFLGDRLIQVLGAGGSRTTVNVDNVIVATGSRPDFHASAKRGVHFWLGSPGTASLTPLVMIEIR
jgi:pyruvate/2-oxoglutarate dehydrogenase complex dihydrolipoamide dehydrogenase (E3) component